MIHFHTLPFFVYAFHHCGYPVLPYLRFLRSSESRFPKFRPRCQALFSSKGESHCYSGWTTTPKAKTHGKHSQSPGLPAIPTFSSFFFFAFWRISENPKQLPKCHDDSWSIDVSSWFSHGKIVEDLCRTWVEAKSYGNTRCFAQAAIKDVRTYSSAKFGHQHWPQSLLFPDVFVVSLRAPWHLFKMDDTWYLPWFA